MRPTCCGFFFDSFDSCRVSPSADKHPFSDSKGLDGGRGRTRTRFDTVNSLFRLRRLDTPQKGGGRWERQSTDNCPKLLARPQRGGGKFRGTLVGTAFKGELEAQGTVSRRWPGARLGAQPERGEPYGASSTLGEGPKWGPQCSAVVRVFLLPP